MAELPHVDKERQRDAPLRVDDMVEDILPATPTAAVRVIVRDRTDLGRWGEARVSAAQLPSDSNANPARSPSTSLLAWADVPWLAVTVLTAVVLRIAWVVYVNVDPNDGRLDDTVFYHNAARYLAEGAGYVDPWWGGPTAAWPPGYPAALAVLYKLFGWHVVLAKGLNIAFAAATVALTYVLARRIFDQRVAYLGALTLACFPGQIYFSTLVFAENMFAMIFVLVLLLTLVWTVERKEARWWQVLLLGSLVGLAGLVRAEGLFLAAVLVGLWAVAVRPWRKVASYAALLALGVALPLAPWTVRNAVQLDQFVPLRTGGGGALALALDPDTPPYSLVKGPETRSVSEGIRYQLTHPVRLFSYAGEKLRYLYGDDSDGIHAILNLPAVQFTPSYRPPIPEEVGQLWRGLANRYFFAVGAAALVAAALCLVRRNRASYVLLGAVLGWTLLFAIISPVSRYHFPLVPITSILAGAFLVFAWDGARSLGRTWSLQRAAGEVARPTEAGERPAG